MNSCITMFITIRRLSKIKMNTYIFFLSIHAILIVHPRYQVLSDAFAMTEMKSKGVMLNQQKFHQPISCYECSTMDYDDPENNLCHYMSYQNQPQIESTINQASSTNQEAMTSYIQDDAPVTKPSDMSASMSQASGVQMALDQFGHSANRIMLNESAIASSADVHHGKSRSRHLQQSQWQTSPIKTRTCSGDEKYCSVVSVVQLIYVNGTATRKFWALERNCSKTCNIGCMIIGELARLRICSHCCRHHDNCNSGNGATQPTTSLNTYYLTALLLAIAQALFMQHTIELN